MIDILAFKTKEILCIYLIALLFISLPYFNNKNIYAAETNVYRNAIYEGSGSMYFPCKPSTDRMTAEDYKDYIDRYFTSNKDDGQILSTICLNPQEGTLGYSSFAEPKFITTSSSFGPVIPKGNPFTLITNDPAKDRAKQYFESYINSKSLGNISVANYDTNSNANNPFGLGCNGVSPTNSQMVCYQLLSSAGARQIHAFVSDMRIESNKATPNDRTGYGACTGGSSSTPSNVKCIPENEANDPEKYICGSTWGTCASGSGFCCIAKPPKTTPIPQEDCAGEIGCMCKEINPSADVLSDLLGEETTNSLLAAPGIGSILSGIDGAPEVVLEKFGLLGNMPPSDLSVEKNDPNYARMLAKYHMGCTANNVCAESRNIAKILSISNTNAEQQAVLKGENKCIAKSEWGWYLYKKNATYQALLKNANSNIAKDTTKSSLTFVQSGLGDDDEASKTDIDGTSWGVEDAKKGLGRMCFKNIAYSTLIPQSFSNEVSPTELMKKWIVDDGKGKYTNEDEWWDGLFDAFRDVGGKIGDNYQNSGLGLVFRGIWAHSDPLRLSSNEYVQTLMEVGDRSQLDVRCTTSTKSEIRINSDQCGSFKIDNCDCSTLLEKGYCIGVLNEIPPACKKSPKNEKKNMKELFDAIDDKRLEQMGIPQNKVSATKSALAQCLDCAHQGGIATAIGCIPVLNVQQFITETVFRIGLSIAGAACIICIIFGAILFQTSQGNSSQVQKAQKMIVNCVVGILVIIFSLFILKFIGIDLLKIPGLS